MNLGEPLPHVECTGSKSCVCSLHRRDHALNLIVPAGGENDFVQWQRDLVQTSIFPGNPDWMFAQITTKAKFPLDKPPALKTPRRNFTWASSMAVGTLDEVWILHNYGALKYRADNQSVNPCVGDPLVMAVDSVENGLYQWTGPNDFEFTLVWMG